MQHTLTDRKVEEIINNEKWRGVSENIAESPEMENTLDAIDMIAWIDEKIDKLNENPSTETIEQVENELRSYEVVTMNQEDKAFWLNEPLKLSEVVLNRPMKNKLIHLLKTGGEWKTDTYKRQEVYIDKQSILPVKVIVNEAVEIDILNGKLLRLEVALIGIRDTIKNMVLDGDVRSGVFQKPHAVVHVNLIHAWLDDESNMSSFIKEALEIRTLYDIAEEAYIVTDSALEKPYKE